jgi:hypothetical protein
MESDLEILGNRIFEGYLYGIDILCESRTGNAQKKIVMEVVPKGQRPNKYTWIMKGGPCFRMRPFQKNASLPNIGAIVLSVHQTLHKATN